MPQTRRKQKLQKQKQERQQSEKAHTENNQKQQSQQVQSKKQEQKPQHKQSQIDNNNQSKEQNKNKPKAKAKKHRKKTYEQQIRINKSKYERIFLLSAERSHVDQDEHWQFLVQGTKGSQYHVNLSTEVKCTCMDFRIKKSPCKHIYFIVTQVGQNDELLDYFKDSKKISNKAYKKLDQQLSNRLKTRLEKPSKQAKDIDLKDDKDCVICFTQIQKQTQPLEDCSTCKKYFHTQCLTAWKNHNPSCPLCRGALSGSGTQNDPLGKLIDIKL